jgi:hypothetical protein
VALFCAIRFCRLALFAESLKLRLVSGLLVSPFSLKAVTKEGRQKIEQWHRTGNVCVVGGFAFQGF